MSSHVAPMNELIRADLTNYGFRLLSMKYASQIYEWGRGDMIVAKDHRNATTAVRLRGQPPFENQPQTLQEFLTLAVLCGVFGVRRQLKAKLTPLPQATRAWYRASGACLCPVCNHEYIEHPADPDELSYDKQPMLHVLCNGDRVKL